MLADLTANLSMQEVSIKQVKTTLHYVFPIIRRFDLFLLQEGTITIDINSHLLLIDTKKDVVKCRLEQVETLTHLPPSNRKILKGKEGLTITFHHPDKILLYVNDDE